METGHAREIGDGVWRLDHRFAGEPGLIGSYLVEGDTEAALIETGPASTGDALRGGLTEAGVEPEQVTAVLVTHIHLDHAGGAGAALEWLPNATLYAHPNGAPHLRDPSRLLKSAARIYGSEMEALWGAVRPVPEERLRVLEDGDTVTVGRRVLRAIDTPGHAGHHHAYHEEASGSLFTGDVAGIRLDGSPYVRPPTPPPEIDLDAWSASIARVRALRPARLCLTHGGSYDDPDDHLDRLLAELHRWAGRLEALDAFVEGEEARLAWFAERADEEIRRLGGDDRAVQRYELSVGYAMNVAGLRRALRRRESAVEGR
jgi:glyoxylase-like metal-dependent hydrolase (beta-lactamase superfamily II)